MLCLRMVYKEELTEKIIGSYYRVYNSLGHGHLEKVYERAMVLELEKRNLIVKTQYPISVYYDGVLVGKFYADIVVNESVLIELKSARHIIKEHEVQLTNYLKSTEIEVGFIFNFGIRPEFKRRIFSNTRKKHRYKIRNSP